MISTNSYNNSETTFTVKAMRNNNEIRVGVVCSGTKLKPQLDEDEFYPIRDIFDCEHFRNNYEEAVESSAHAIFIYSSLHGLVPDTHRCAPVKESVTETDPFNYSFDKVSDTLISYCPELADHEVSIMIYGNVPLSIFS